MAIERRYFTDDLEIRASDGEAPKIRGYAARFNVLSEDLGGFREKIAAGAFSKAIQNGDVRALWNHDPNFVLGRTKAATLELREDDKGLVSEITPPDTTWARDLMESIKRRDVSQMSFGFQMVKEEWNSERKERTLLEVRLFDVSPVTFPAYPQTKVSVRMSALTELIERAESGRELTPDELRFLESHVSDVLHLLPTEPGTPHSAGDDQKQSAKTRIDGMRRLLQIAEVAV